MVELAAFSVKKLLPYWHFLPVLALSANGVTASHYNNMQLVARVV